MTFLALFLTALYEPEEMQKKCRCSIHPVKKRSYICNKYIDYAADMTIVLAYFKCMDDWADEKKKLSLRYGKMLEKKYLDVKRRYPRQCRGVQSALQKLSVIEKTPDAEPDAPVNCSGNMLSELFVYEEDFWSGSLRHFGFELGRFIYLMDAAVDYSQDRKKGNYNPLYIMGKKPEEMEDILMDCIGGAAAEFENLPIIEGAGIIRNVLYSGVWQKYRAKLGKEKEDGR